MNIRKAKKIIKRCKDFNSLPLYILRTPSGSVQKMLDTKDFQYGIVEFSSWGIDSYYETSDIFNHDVTNKIEFNHLFEKGGEPRLDWFEEGLWDKEFGLTNDRDYYDTSHGTDWLINVGCDLYYRPLLKKEYDWLMKNLTKYKEVYPGISIKIK